MTYAKQKCDGGPNSLKLLAYRFKKQSKRDYNTKLKTGDSTEILTENYKIAEEFAKYYVKLYKDGASNIYIYICI